MPTPDFFILIAIIHVYCCVNSSEHVLDKAVMNTLRDAIQLLIK